jgi:hypothetical protein
MPVLVEDAAEAIASSYVEAGHLVRIGDLRWHRFACRQSRPARSCGTSVLVKDAAESVASSYVEAGDRVWIGDRRSAWQGV